MPVLEWTRTKGKRLTYSISYDKGEYFIQRNGMLKKTFADSVIAGITPKEASPSLMLRMAIADIEALLGMEE